MMSSSFFAIESAAIIIVARFRILSMLLLLQLLVVLHPMLLYGLQFLLQLLLVLFHLQLLLLLIFVVAVAIAFDATVVNRVAGSYCIHASSSCKYAETWVFFDFSRTATYHNTDLVAMGSRRQFISI